MQVVLNRKRRRQRNKWRLAFRLLLVFLLLASGSAVALLSYTRMLGPPPIQVSQTTVIYGDNNEIIGETHHGENRYWVSLSDISQDVIDATISVEDRKFFQHLGFDPKRIAGAILANIRSGEKSQGASTITQQYARNLYLNHEKTWTRKWNELLYALRLEMNYEKEEILEGYLNTVYYGHGAYGIEAASAHFFNKDSRDLTLAEASMLAGIPKGPSYYSPLTNEELGKKRQKVVLFSMVENEMITQQEADAAFEEELIYIERPHQTLDKVGPYFHDVVNYQLVHQLGIEPDLIEAGGLQVYTTLDAEMQKKAEKIIEQEMPTNELEIGFVAMDPKTGYVKALVGGKQHVQGGFNRAVQAQRQPGSTMKPFLYYGALESGFTATTTLKSEKTDFPIDGQSEPYSPDNFNSNFAEDYITMIQALAFSDNIYAVKTHYFIGLDTLGEITRRVGLNSTIQPHPSSALGSSSVNVLEMVNGYSAFANGGFKTEPLFIKKVENIKGEVLFENKPTYEQVLDPELTFIMTDLMTAMFDRQLNDYTSVTGGSVAPFIKRPVAGKSGSTSTDSWMIGFTPQLVTGVWVGYDDSRRLQTKGDSQVSKQVWAKFTEEALANELKLPFQPPRNLTALEVDPKTGLLANENCTGRLTYFVKGTEPTESCPSSEKEMEETVQEESEEEHSIFKRFLRWMNE
ncbi:penicillin-binding protein 2D [Bacillus sp. TS-2]|nr:penicillin-binding protein 2D [Bacillus sp. TS-2]